ncbi:hypothetical protein LINPERPRIM_LOCUS39902 [Linum perenne]
MQVAGGPVISGTQLIQLYQHLLQGPRIINFKGVECVLYPNTPGALLQNLVKFSEYRWDLHSPAAGDGGGTSGQDELQKEKAEMKQIHDRDEAIIWKKDEEISNLRQELGFARNQIGDLNGSLKESDEAGVKKTQELKDAVDKIKELDAIVNKFEEEATQKNPDLVAKNNKIEELEARGA